MSQTENNKSDPSDAESNTEPDPATVNETYAQLLERYQALEAHTKEIIELRSTAAEMMGQNSIDHLLDFIAREIVRLTVANGAYMHMVHESEDFLEVIASCGALSAQLTGDTRKRGVGLSAQAWESGQYVYTENYNAMASKVVVFPEELQAVAIPLSFSSKVCGVAFVTAALDKDIKSQIPFLMEIAKIAALAIDHKNQLLIHRNEARRMRALSTLGHTLYESRSWDEVLDTACKNLFDIFEIERLSIHQNINGDGKLVSRGTHIRSGDTVQLIQSFNKSLSAESIASWSFKHGEFAQINRNTTDDREDEKVHKFRQTHNIGSTMCAPISFDDNPWGVILIAKNENLSDFNESDANAFQMVASIVSTTLQREDLLTKVKHQAYHDSLTGLPNRRSFEAEFARLTRDDNAEEYAILFCDLDRFKAINDSHGHSVGDEVLKICANRMRTCIGPDNYLARMGGDEFAVIVNISKKRNQVTALADRLINAVDEPLQVDSYKLSVGISIGISFYPLDSRSFSELLNHADVAMYQAKNSNRGKILLFNKQDADEIRSKNELRSSILDAVNHNEFELRYQPQVNWQKNKVVGAEALVRWNHPEKGMISPAEFIPVAEESGVIDSLGYWIIEESLNALINLGLVSDEDFSISINVAPQQFLDNSFAINVLQLLSKFKVAPNKIKIEITESFIERDRDIVVEQLRQLRESGVTIAIDDFGTGYSSLSYLQDLPVDTLKIDRSFIKSLTRENYGTSLAGSIVALASSLQLDTVIEGIETVEQLELTQLIGGTVIQGYLYSQPVPEHELRSVIETIEASFTELKKSA